MKGKLHTDELLEAVLDREAGLRTERRLSHVFALDVPDHERLLFITDAAINIAPDLPTLADIVQNAMDLAIALGIETPRAAILSAVETVTSKLPSTLLAASICKMHDRGRSPAGWWTGRWPSTTRSRPRPSRPRASNRTWRALPISWSRRTLKAQHDFQAAHPSGRCRGRGRGARRAGADHADQPLRQRRRAACLGGAGAASGGGACEGTRLMAGVVLILNTGSSSVKFALHDAIPATTASPMARSRAWDARPPDAARRRGEADPASRPGDGAGYGRADRLAAGHARRAAGPAGSGRGRAPRGAWRAGLSPPRAHHRRGHDHARGALPAGTRAPALQPHGHPGDRRALAGLPADRLFRHRVPPQPPAPRAAFRAAPRAVGRGHPALRVSRPVLRSHRRMPAGCAGPRARAKAA